MPNPMTERLLKHYGYLFRQSADGFSVYAEIEPGSDPLQLLRLLDGETVSLTFLLYTKNSYVLNVSQLPTHQPGKSVFYFNNLHDDQASGRLHLGDSVATQRVGGAIQWVSGEVYTHHFAFSVNAATLEVQDLFGNVIHTTSFSHPFGETMSEHRLLLTEIPKIVPGRYLVTDNHGGSQPIYFDPEQSLTRPFGVIEIFNRTDELTPNNTDLVPGDYRFLNGDQLTGLAPYHIQFEARSTTWRYNVIKKYTTNSVPLNELNVAGDLTFTKVTGADRAVFTAVSAESLREVPRTVLLQQNGNTIRNLPSPQLTTVLQEGLTADSFMSDLYVYV